MKYRIEVRIDGGWANSIHRPEITAASPRAAAAAYFDSEGANTIHAVRVTPLETSSRYFRRPKALPIEIDAAEADRW